LETLHIILTWMYLYEMTVTGYGIPTTLKTMPWPLGTSLIVSATAGSSVQVCMNTFRANLRSYGHSSGNLRISPSNHHWQLLASFAGLLQPDSATFDCYRWRNHLFPLE
jgi:hypothetical protein